MFKVTTIFAVLLTVTAAVAEDAGRASVTAAIADARSQLRSEIMAARVIPGLTVQQFLERTDSPDALDSVIARAQQIGGPRWIDEQTCQVKLEVPGDRVAYALISLAAVRPGLAPVPAKALEQRLAEMKQRTFVGTGTAISASKVADIRPVDGGGVWMSISDADRSKAVDAARRDAMHNLLTDIRPIQVQGGPSVGQLLDQEPVRKAVDSWLATRPVTQVRFQDDLSVVLTVATPPDELLDTVVNSARATPGAASLDTQSIEQLRHEFARHVSAAVGRAGVSATGSATLPAQRVELPVQPPRWVWGGALEAEGAAPRDPVPLKTKTNAEKQAAESLRTRVGALALTPTMTVSDAAAQDPRIGSAVDRVLLRTRVTNVQWLADGGVRVKLNIDPADLWNELRQATDR